MFNNKKLLKSTSEITKTGLALSFGSQLSSEEYSKKAVANISNQMPTISNIQGSGAVVESLKLLDPRRLKKR
jgi:maleate cis-trans isomerase